MKRSSSRGSVASCSESDSDDAILQLAQRPQSPQNGGDEQPRDKYAPVKSGKKRSQPRRRNELTKSYMAFHLGVKRLRSQPEMFYEAESDSSHSECSDLETDGSGSDEDDDGRRSAKIEQFVKSSRIIHPDGTVQKSCR